MPQTASAPTQRPPSSSDWSGTRCLVTGAAGFIGSALCAALQRRGASVCGAGRRAPDVPGLEVSAACDVGELDQVRDLFRQVKPDVVFNCASKVTGARDLEVVHPTMRDNLLGAVHVLLAAAEEGGAHVVSFGSLQEPDDLSGSEIAPSPYAAAKLAASAYGRMFAELYDLPVSVARLYMVYGPGQRDYTKVVPYVLKRLLSGEPARMSSGSQPFDWIFIDDAVDAVLALAASDERTGRRVDLGTGTLTTVRDIVSGIAHRLDLEHLLEFGAIPDRRLEPVRKADIETTAGAIGWRPAVAVDEGLDRTVAWYREKLRGR